MKGKEEKRNQEEKRVGDDLTPEEGRIKDVHCRTITSLHQKGTSYLHHPEIGSQNSGGRGEAKNTNNTETNLQLFDGRGKKYRQRSRPRARKGVISTRDRQGSLSYYDGNQHMPSKNRKFKIQLLLSPIPSHRPLEAPSIPDPSPLLATSVLGRTSTSRLSSFLSSGVMILWGVC